MKSWNQLISELTTWLSRKVQKNKTKPRSNTDDRLATGVYYIAKKKNTRKQEKADEVGQKRGWLLLQDLILPQCFYMPMTQATKETQLEPDTAEGKMQGVGSWGAFSKYLPATRQRRWGRRIFLLTYQHSSMNRTYFGFWLKEGETPFPLGRNGVFSWTYASCAHTLLFWVSWGHGASVAERVLSSQPSPQTCYAKGG